MISLRVRKIRPSSWASLGAIAAVLVLSTGYLAFGLLKHEPFAQFTNARVLMANSGTVSVGTPVLLTGVQVGRITAVRNVPDGVEIGFRITSPYRIPVASEVRVENLSALGEPYVNFRPTTHRTPTSRETVYISDGQVLDARGAPAPTLIPELATRLVAVIDQLDPAAITGLVSTVDQALDGTESAIPTIERANTLLAAAVISRTPLIYRLLDDLQTAGADMKWAGPALAASGPHWSDMGERLDELINVAARLFEVGDAPQQYLTGDGIVPFLQRVEQLLADIGPEMAELAPVLEPIVGHAADSLAPVNISALISAALASVGKDGAIRVQLGGK